MGPDNIHRYSKWMDAYKENHSKQTIDMTLEEYAKLLAEASNEMSVINKAKLKPNLNFVPVIFANGKDDDKLGLDAAFKNDRVQYEDKIYEANENIIIVNKIIALCDDLTFFNHEIGIKFSIYRLNEGHSICYKAERMIQFHSCRCVKLKYPRM